MWKNVALICYYYTESDFTGIGINVRCEKGMTMLQIQEISLERLRPWEDNPRVNDHAVSAVAESIRKFGFNVPILCDQNMTIIAGHTRWKAAKELALSVVPVIIVEMTDARRRAFAVADNKLAELAKWDFPKLRDVLESLRSEDIEFESLGFSNEEMRRLLLGTETDEDAVPILPAESVMQKGDMIILGDHRLILINGSTLSGMNMSNILVT